MDNNLFDTGEMEALLSQLSEAQAQNSVNATANSAMTKEMEASQRRCEEYINKHNN